MKNKFLLTGLMILGVSMLSGCSVIADATYDFTTPDNVNVTAKISIDKASVDAVNDGQPTSPEAVVEVIDGVEYYTETESQTIAGDDALKGQSTETGTVGKITKDIVYLESDPDDSMVSQYEDTTDDMSMLFTCTFNNDVPYVETSGALSNDNKTVVFKMDNASASNKVKWYAYTEKGKQLIAANKITPTVYLGEMSQWNNEEPLFETEDLFWGTTTVKCNGKQITRYLQLPGKVEKVVGTKSKTKPATLSSWTTSDGKPASKWLKQGKNKIVVSNPQGFKTAFTYNYDSKAPVINAKSKSFKNKAVFTVSVKTSGISKVTYNGKKVSIKKLKNNAYRVTIDKKGKGTVKVYDKAGNVSTVKITIK